MTIEDFILVFIIFIIITIIIGLIVWFIVNAETVCYKAILENGQEVNICEPGVIVH